MRSFFYIATGSVPHHGGIYYMTSHGVMNLSGPVYRSQIMAKFIGDSGDSLLFFLFEEDVVLLGGMDYSCFITGQSPQRADGSFVIGFAQRSIRPQQGWTIRSAFEWMCKQANIGNDWNILFFECQPNTM